MPPPRRFAEAAAAESAAAPVSPAATAQAAGQPVVSPAAGSGPEAENGPSLFLVVLGGRVANAHLELHDVRFVAGQTIDETLPALRRQWFGRRRGLHLDSWMVVRFVDGYRVELRPEPFAGPERLWFVNMGGYDPAQLAEQHAFGLFVATSPQGAKAAARRRLLPGLQQRHKDDLHGVAQVLGDGVDGCLDVQLSLAAPEAAPGEARRPLGLHLIPDGRQQPQIPDWFGYRLI
jgi:hypothetical protein